MELIDYGVFDYGVDQSMVMLLVEQQNVKQEDGSIPAAP